MNVGVRVKDHLTVGYAGDYLGRGYAPIPIRLGDKNPGYGGWNEWEVGPEELTEVFAKPCNIGLLLGEPSGGLVDVDADVAEAVTVVPAFLPKTVASGRENNPRSHMFYKSHGARTIKYKDVDGEMLLELRSDGHQTLVAPSVHPDGDRYLWDLRDGSEPTQVAPEALATMCNKAATATLIARHLPPSGGRHDYAMALAGYLLRPGRLDEETTEKIMKEAWSAGGGDTPDAVRDIEGIVRDTARKISDGGPVVGGPTLESLAPGVVGLLTKWWGWGKDESLKERSLEPVNSGHPTKTGTLPPALPFPVEVLTPTMKRIVEEAAASIGCPPEFIGLPMLATLGAAIGNTHMVRMKKGWTEGAALNVAVIADPGEKKTPAFNAAIVPAWKRQAELRREFQNKVRRYQADLREWEAAKKKATASGKVAPEPPTKPVMHRTVVEDTTVEALVECLSGNPRGVLCSRDELSGWVRSMDQYKGGKGSDRQDWLSFWSASPMVVDRKGKEPLMVDKPFVGVAGSIQPDVLPELKNGREDGLLDRFLFAYPEPVHGLYSEDEISEEAVQDYQKLYDGLYRMDMKLDDNGDPVPTFVEFTEGAKKMWIREVDTLRQEMRHPRFPRHLRGPWSKQEAYLSRLSLIMALSRVKEPGTVSSRLLAVTEADVVAAAKLIAYFKAHARRVYARLHGERPEILLLLSLRQLLDEQGGYWEGTTSELYSVLERRSAPGLPGGEVPLGKWLKGLVPEDGLLVEEGHRGKRHIVKISLYAPKAAAGAITIDGGEVAVIGPAGTEVPRNTATQGAEAEILRGLDAEGTEGKDNEDGPLAGKDGKGPSPHGGVPNMTPEISNEPFTDDYDHEADQDRLDQVWEVLNQGWHFYEDPQDLIDRGVFYELEFDPSRAEIEEVQWRYLNK